MYIPKLYREEDREEILKFLTQNNFPVLVTHDGEKLIATHLPVEVIESEDGALTVLSHMSRANPQWKTFGEQEVLLIFQGAHTYISPRWYDHVNVPTWNYTMVHLYGKIRLVEGDELYSLLGNLVKKHEASTSYSLEGLPQDFAKKEMHGAVGFAMDITRVDAGYKLSQNRNDEDQENIIRELEKRGDDNSTGVAKSMKEKRSTSRAEPPPK
ncbi:MAG: FMN-binding negative transcriptional regulator [Anaerolineales bacterium]|nr:FMN-binding negative transcriptional regulator [Anaerolineales bacterium]